MIARLFIVRKELQKEAFSIITNQIYPALQKLKTFIVKVSRITNVNS